MFSTSCLASSILLLILFLGFSFLIFMNDPKGPPSALWECGFREAVSKPLWEVWESRKTFPCFPRGRHFHEAFVLKNVIGDQGGIENKSSVLRVLQKGSLKDGGITIGFHDRRSKVVYHQASRDPSEEDPGFFNPVDQR